MEEKELERLVAICRSRNEMDFLYTLTKLFADVDGVGSAMEGLPGSSWYNEANFNNAEKTIVSEKSRANGGEDYYCDYLAKGGIYFYELYLKQIGVI